MDEYSSEEEQLEAIRKWWSENGKFIVSGIVLGILGLVGWNRYTAMQEQTAQQASEIFERLRDAVETGDADVAEAAQGELERDYSATPYLAQARLATARLHMENGRAENAAQSLRELIDSDADHELKLVARVRLARVLLYLEKYDDAKGVLSGVESGSFQARFDEVIGDIEVARSNHEAARIAYNAALDNAGSQQLINVELVRMKLADLGPAPEPASEDTTQSSTQSTTQSSTQSSREPSQ